MMLVQDELHTQTGFTLIEFVLVIFIGTILWGLMIQGYHQFNRFRASLLYEQTIQLFILGHQIAKATGKPVVISCHNQRIALQKQYDYFMLNDKDSAVNIPYSMNLTCEATYQFLPDGQLSIGQASVDTAKLSIDHYTIWIDGQTSYVY